MKRQIDTRLYERLLHTQEAEALQDVAGPKRAALVLKGLGGMKDAESDAGTSPFKDPYVATLPRSSCNLQS